MKSPKRYFVTGGAGFIGSHLVDLLLKEGHTVTTIDNILTGNILNLLNANQHEHHRFFQQDVMEFSWDEELREGDVLVHLAATVGVEKVYESTLDTMFNNCYPTQLLLDKCAAHGCKLVYASTSEVYGESENDQSNEFDTLHLNIHHKGRSAYTLSKLHGELLCLSHAQEYQLPVVVLRFFNTIGKRQSPLYGMVVPRFIRQALNNEPITVFGDGMQTRCFCDVNDLVQGIYQTTINDAVNGGIYNLGNDEPITILELANFIKEVLHSESEIVFVPPPESRVNRADTRNRKPDLLSVMKAIDWKPKMSWKESIVSMIHDSVPQTMFQHDFAKG